MWFQKRHKGPKRPHDAHDASSWGSAGRLKCTINPRKRSKYTLWAVFVAVNTSVSRVLYDKHETGLACLAQAKPYKMCMSHGFVCFAHISSTFVALLILSNT